MGYDLYPRNKNLKPISFGVFTWPSMLHETGMDYVLNCGRSIYEGRYIYQKKNNKDGSPLSNDSFPVSSFEAKCMAKVALGYVFVYEEINRQWKDLEEEERDEIYRSKSKIRSVDENFLLKLKAFAEFAQNSKGFRIA